MGNAPITYELDGEQYVAIAAGGVSIQTTSANGDTIWGFSMKGSPGGRLKPFDAPRPPVSVVGFTGPIVEANAIKFIDYDLTPPRITVKAGTKVTFTNDGTQSHNAASSDAGGWDTGMLAKGQSAAITFNRPGTYNYNCAPHPSMIGQIIVTGEAVMTAPPTVVERTAAAPQGAAGHEHAG